MPTYISPERARRSDYSLIDVREFPEYAQGAIKGSQLVPLATVEREARNWDKSAPVILVCRSGKRATQAAESLERLGFSNVNVLEGGFEGWKAAGHPAEVSEKRPWSMERQVRAIAGSFVVVFTSLGLLVSPLFFGATLFVGAGLVFAGVTDICMMATVLGKLPWNRPADAKG